MEYVVNFSSGMKELGGVSECRLFRLSPESSTFILQEASSGSERLLLCDVERIGSGALPVLSPEELAELGILPEEASEALPEDVVVLCRLRIPQDAPQRAGFDLGRLVVVNKKNGRAVEAERPGASIVPLVPHR